MPLPEFKYLPSSNSPFSGLLPGEQGTSLQDEQIRRLLEKGQVPSVGAPPGMQSQQANPIDMSSMSGLFGLASPQQTEQQTAQTKPAEKQPTTTDQLKEIRKLIDTLHVQDEGILGTGITKSQGLMAVLGALATKNMPQQQAMEMTLKLMGLPQQMETARQSAVMNKLKGLLGGITAERDIAKIPGEEAKSQLEIQQLQRKKVLDEFLLKKLQSTSGPAPATPGTIPSTTPGPQASEALPTERTLAQAAGGETIPGLPPKEKRLEFSGIGASGEPTFRYEEAPYTYQELLQNPTLNKAQAAYIATLDNKQQKEQLGLYLKMHQEVTRADKERVPNQGAIKVFADTKIRSPGVPEGMTWEQAVDQVGKETQRQIDIAGARAGAVTAAVSKAQANLPAGAALTSMLRYNNQTKEFEFAGSVLPADASMNDARKAGFFELKGPGASQHIEAIKIDGPMRRAFKQMAAAAQIATGSRFAAQSGLLSGGSLGGSIGRAGAFYDAEKKQFSQIFDKYWGGVRGASSSQLAQLVASRLPIIGIGIPFGDSLPLAKTKLQAIENILDSLKTELAARVGGKPDRTTEDKTNNAIMKLLGIDAVEFNRLTALESSSVVPQPPWIKQ